MASTFPDLPIFRAIASHDPHKTAIIHSKSNRRFTYGQLLKDVEGAKVRLYHQLKAATPENEPIGGQRVALLMENGYDYVVTLLSIFACDSIAIPLSSSFPASELRYIIDNSEAVTLLSTGMFQQQADEVLKGVSRSPTLNVIDKTLSGSGHDEVQLVQLPKTKGGMMLYTSGTTSRPKGVVLNTSTLTAQCQSLLNAWNYLPTDHLLHTLPLHHIHGTVNALLTPLFAGSTIEFLFPFNADAVWSRLAAPFLPSSTASSPPQDPITFLTAVPTIYTRLLSSHPRLPPSVQSAARSAISPPNLRLNISGSAALPTPTKTAWSDLSSGNVLLERYGMTEVGMALSCGLAFTDRVDGSVGWPLPGVEVRLVDTETSTAIPLGNEIDPNSGKEREGEIQLRGPTVFSEYWRNESATSSEFSPADPDDPDQDRWFKTGDIATRRPVPGTGETQKEWATGPCYFIRGRQSTDIIKTGGEKVSALEIERELLGLAQVAECAVVGVENEQWGQKVCAIVVLADGWVAGGNRRRSQEVEAGASADESAGKPWSMMDMRRALKDKLAAYKVPQEMKVVEQLQKNAMGKVNKKALVKEVFG